MIICAREGLYCALGSLGIDLPPRAHAETMWHNKWNTQISLLMRTMFQRRMRVT